MNGEYVVTILLVLGIVGFLLILRGIRQSRNFKSPSFNAPRIAVLDDTRIDRNRRLVLVRRDNVEHLLLIGGSTDVVVEQYMVGSESYNLVSELEPVEESRQGIGSKRNASQLQLKDKSARESVDKSNREIARKQDTETSLELKEATTDRLPPIIDDLTKSPVKSTQGGQKPVSISDRDMADQSNATGWSPNNSEKYETSRVAATIANEQIGNAENSFHSKENAVASATDGKEVVNPSIGRNPDTDSDKPNPLMKKIVVEDGSKFKSDSDILEKLQNRQSREPVPPDRMPKLKTESEVRPVEMGTESASSGQIDVEANNLSGNSIKPVDFIDNKNKVGTEIPQSNPEPASSLCHDKPMEGESSQPSQEKILPNKESGGKLSNSDEDVFETIGKEMTKILTELRKNTSQNSQKKK